MVKIKMEPINASNTTLSSYKRNRHRKFDAKQAKRHDFGKAHCMICDKVFTKYHYKTKLCSEECRKEHTKSRLRQYAKDNREKLNAYKRKYREENPEQVRASHRKYQRNNREKIRAYQRKHHAENREKIKARKRIYQREYRAKKKEE